MQFFIAIHNHRKRQTAYILIFIPLITTITNEKIKFRIGEYTVSEVGDSVSAGYVLPADKKASVKVGSTTVVEMHNVLRDTPKTGDNSKVGLWTVLAGLSALGIAGTVFAALRKKKKEDDE